MTCFLSPKESTQGASGFLAFSNFNYTLDKETIMNRVLLCIFPRIPSIPKELILFFSFNRSFKNSSIFLTLFKLFSIGCISQITLRHEGFSLGCNFQTVYLHKMQVSTGVPIYIDLHFIQNGTSRFLGSLSNPQSSRNEDTMKAKRN